MISITLIIVIITGLISYRAFNDTAVRQKLIFHPYSVKNSGEMYRFLTHGFIHGDWTHLLVNMYVLYLFGEFIEIRFMSYFNPVIGKVVYLFFYISAIVISSLPTYFKHLENPLYRALGASGATSALVFAYIFFNPWGWFVFPPLPAIIFGIAYLFYSSYMEKRGMDNIGHNVHFWGAIYGFLFILLAVLWFLPEQAEFFFYQLKQGPTGPDFL